MKASIHFSWLLVTVACTSTTSPTPEAISSVNTYATPIFDNVATLDNIDAAFPVIEKLYRDYAEKNNMPAVAFGIVANGELVFSGAMGLANQETKVPATTRTLFRIASMSKSFTAMAILKLRDEGKLSLSDPASKYVPALRKAGRLTADAPEITIADLLTMSAGFPEDNPWGDRQLDDTDEELEQLIADGISFSNAPGITFEYSNLGFAILGRIVAVVSGMSYQSYITANIMKPIGMSASKWEVDDVPPADLAMGYRWEDNTYKPEPYLHDGSYGAMGGLICSIEDFSKYVALHLDAWPPRNDEETGPVKRASLREMHQPRKITGLFADARTRSGEVCPVVAGYGYGLGWRKDCKGILRVSHSGGLPGFGSEWRIYPDYGIGVVSFSNLTYGAPSPPNAVALDTLISIAGLKPRTLPASQILEQRKQQIVEVLPSWRDDQVRIFAENFFMDQSLDTWKRAAAAALAEAGEITNVTGIIPENQLRGTFMIEGTKKNITVFFTLTPEREPLVQQLDLQVGEKSGL
jgi:CubicO group peptidase (beta-lactamase class C family)